MLDFTTDMYTALCQKIVETNYTPYTVAEYIRKKPTNAIILRHDVDRAPASALTLAKIEYEYGLKSTYYFRFIRSVFIEATVKEIGKLGHEVGYHYETLSKCGGDYDQAGKLFKTELDAFREIVPVKTASMHGKPFSKWNNLELWKHYDINEFDLIGEAYLGIDYSMVNYYSDTGRTWHGTKYNLRDTVDRVLPQLEIETTSQLMALLSGGEYDSICLLTHPNRWVESRIGWLASYCSDFMVNQAKVMLKKMRRNP